MADPIRIGAVIIGRNEGARLVGCLNAVPEIVTRVVYVDSGSTDNSVQAASDAGAEVVNLDMTQPFTAARARNAGFDRLIAGGPVDFVQFIDGDCELQPGWVETAAAFLIETPEAAVACGRRRERFPDATVYNRLCDWEWDTPVGRAKACGGDALMRVEAVQQVGGYNPDLIAGEEPDLCVRLRAKGWTVWRLDHEMTLHDAAMTRFGQWWKRAKRAGHAFAEGAAMHGAPPERHWVAETRRALFWGAGIPALIVLGALATPLALLGLVIYPVQVMRLARQHGMERAFFLVLSKFPEALGALEYHLRRLTGKRRGLIEYK
ncbi:glycosyltransferase [Actibacterium sp. XHP0104]|uniref:glycosyltransferase n=1 Tax=Actibacterium sp. XHP0104 TaxID=2984335 RepID=UPI0021E85A9A|nr:glycosyltransferase [Actibacterium sp. XHP0104]MCV2881869.1 glycosyltransferase [Actibacterium sp. XHP0104]